MADTKKVYQQISDKEGELSPLYTQMDEDFDIFNLKKFELLDYEGKAVKNVDSVTLNAPRVYALRLMSVINSAELGINIVNHTLTDDIVTGIKKVFYTCLNKGDALLKRKQIGRIRNNLVKIAALRGRVGLRTLLWQGKDGTFYYDYLPLDPRFCAWEVGIDGLEWYSYKVVKSKATVLSEYDEVTSGTLAVVTEYWDKESHVIFIDDKAVVTDSNPSKKVPAIIIPIGEALSVRHKDPTAQIKLDGESIYSSVRGTFPNMNKAASILMTTAAFGFRPPIQRVVPPNVESSEEIDETVKTLYTGGATIIDAGHSRFEPMPLKDIAQSLPVLYGVLSAEKQQATFPDIEYGDIRYPLSAIAIAKLTEGRNQIFQPIVEAIQDCYVFALEMTKLQMTEGGLKPKAEELDVSSLNNQFDIEAELHVVSPEENISRYTVAAAARGFLDSETIRTDILKLKDEGQVQIGLDKDFTEAMVPELRAYREAMRLQGTDPDPDTEAMIITKKLGLAMGAGQPGQPQGAPPQGGGSVIPPTAGTMEGSAAAAKNLSTALGMTSTGAPPTEQGQP